MISERSINTALNRLADIYEHGPTIYCFQDLSTGDPDAQDRACVLGHLHFMIPPPEGHGRFNLLARMLGHRDAYEFYQIIYKVSGRCLSTMSQEQVAEALRKYAAAYHLVEEQVWKLEAVA